MKLMKKGIDGMNNVEFHCEQDNPLGVLQLAILSVHAGLCTLHPMLGIIFDWPCLSHACFFPSLSKDAKS